MRRFAFSSLPNGAAGTLTANSLIRLSSVTLRALLTIAMAAWLQPSEMGLYAVIAATLTLTAYLFGLDFQTFTMRELSSRDLVDARLRVRDQFSVLVLIYAIGGPIVALILRQFSLDPRLIALVVPIAIVQHLALELYRILTRLGRTIAGSVVLLIRDGLWAPACILVKLLTGELSLLIILVFWLFGSLASAVYGAGVLFSWLPSSERRPVDLGWLAAGFRTGLRMLAGTLSLVALFSLDRMIFAKLASPDQLGAYGFYTIGCASVQGLFETAILPSFWSALFQAKKDGGQRAVEEAQRRLTQACVAAAIMSAFITAGGLTILSLILAHPTYAANLDLLYYLVAAYSLLTLANIPHYRLFAARMDSQIVAANLTAFVTFLALVAIIVPLNRLAAVPLALALACAALFALKWTMARRLVGRHGTMSAES